MQKQINQIKCDWGSRRQILKIVTKLQIYQKKVVNSCLLTECSSFKSFLYILNMVITKYFVKAQRLYCGQLYFSLKSKKGLDSVH